MNEQELNDIERNYMFVGKDEIFALCAEVRRLNQRIGEAEASLVAMDKLTVENARLRAALELAEVEGIAAAMDLAELPDSEIISIGNWKYHNAPFDFNALVKVTAGHFRILRNALKGGAQ